MSNKIPNRINPLTRKKLNSSQGVESYRLILCTTSVFRVEKELGTSLFIVKDPPPPHLPWNFGKNVIIGLVNRAQHLC